MKKKATSARSKDVDTYIAKAAPFARPILTKLRELFHAGAPGCREELKWRCPAFVGNGIIGGMAAFKEHVSWGLWRWPELDDPAGILRQDERDGMWGAKPRSVADLPKDAVLLDYIARAAALDAAPRTAKKRASTTIAVPKTPSDFGTSLAAVPLARAVFDALAPSARREYIEWIVEARAEDTRARRIEHAIDWLREGKSRNWKYEGAGSEAKANARLAAARARLGEAEMPSKRLKKVAKKTAKKAAAKKSATQRTTKKV
jgi:hypothetical protein